MNAMISAVPAAHELRWNLGSIYPGLDSDPFHSDLRAAHAELMAVQNMLSQDDGWCAPPARAIELPQQRTQLEEFSRRCSRASELLADLHVYCSALLSLGDAPETARESLRRISALAGLLQVHEQRVGSALLGWPKADFESLCAAHSDGHYGVVHWQMLRAKAASPAVDPNVMLLAPEASRAWSALYQALARDLKVSLRQPSGAIQEVRLAQATTVLTGTDESQRKLAWYAIRAAWQPHETTVAAILNSLAGHRLKIHRLIGVGGDVRAPSLVENRIQASTLDALMSAVQTRRGELRYGLRRMAALLGKSVLDPWDLAAGFAATDAAVIRLSPAECLAEVRAAFVSVAPEMGEFVDRMASNGWIDARPGEGRRQLGAYQTSLRRGCHPIVFTNCEGRWSDLVVLAHELGHAFHYWLIRDQPAYRHHLPMALSECASSFAEMQIRRRRVLVDPQHGGVAGDWDKAQAAVAFLLNIGASYTFELELYQRRSKRELTAAELSERLMSSWQFWFGQEISAFDDKGWVRKAHFSGPRPFNNYPYMIGYLVAARLESERVRRGQDFFGVFQAFLRGSATLSLEDLVKQLFDQDSGSDEFWAESVNLVLAGLKEDS
jgi:oligoendopeptidase F